jgi:hypothetical protein
MTDPALAVRTAASGLDMPIGIAFLGPSDWFVIEKNTGRVQRVVNGVVQSTVLDLAVNAGSERGLLGIALHPFFSFNGWVYLYWTCRSDGPAADPFFPSEQECPDPPVLGADTVTESESLLIGTGFGVVTDIKTGPNGNLFVVSLLTGSVYEVFRP